MGKLYVGNTFIDLLGELKVGTATVQKVYAGSTLVFPQAGTTTTTTSSSTSTTTSTSTSTSTTSTTTTEAPTTTTTTTSFEPSLVYAIGYSSGTYNGYGTNLDACDACYATATPLLTVYSVSTLNNGALLFLDAARTIPFTSTGGYFWASGGIGICFNFTYSTQIDNFTTCAPITTTTTSTSSTSTTTTTSSTSTTTTTSSTSTTTSTSTSTTTSTTTEAPTTTTTTTTELQVQVDWGVDEQGSGAVQLIIKDNTNTELVNQESQGTGPITGTIYIPQSKTPYTVTVTVTAGAEVAQYRICNVTNSTEIVYDSSVPTSDTYTVSPTPLHSSVYATYGNSNVPPACPV